MKKYIISAAFLCLFVVPSLGADAASISIDQLFGKLVKQADKVLVLDVRDFSDFLNGSIRGAKNLPFNFIPGKFAGLPKNKEIIIVSKDDATSQNAAETLKKLGVRNKIATVSGGMGAWEEKYPVDLSIDKSEIKEISAGDLDSMIKDVRPYTLLDIRSKNDFAAGHIPTAVSMPLEEVVKRVGEIDPDSTIITYSRDPISAYNAAKFFGDKGYPSVRVLSGGFTSWVKEGKRVYN